MKHVLINPLPKYMSTNFRRELHSRLISNTILNFWQPKLWNSGTEKKMTKDTKLWEYDQLETTKVILVHCNIANNISTLMKTLFPWREKTE